MREIKKIHRAISAPIGDLITYRALPTNTIDHLDPFLFLNHHGPQVYKPNNNGLPFGPHPHRGFETLTFILDGDVMHRDSGGGKSIIKAGGIQWMTAGSGVIHTEVSSEEFKQKGGKEELIQIWLNLPARLKMTEPNYIGLQQDQVPMTDLGNGVSVQAIAGNWSGHPGPVKPLTDLEIARLKLRTDAIYNLRIPENHNILFYILNGKLEVNGQTAGTHNLIEFRNSGTEINITALEDSELIIGHGKPTGEPIVAHGPFVMNSQQEIRQAMQDYQSGKMGVWTED